MPKKVIQVPMGSELLEAVNNVSKRQRRARAELIREACSVYLHKIELEELERQYACGYRKTPEKIDVGTAQAALLTDILPDEEW